MNAIGYVLIWVFLIWHYSLRCGYISDDHATVEKRKDIIPDAEKNPKIEKAYFVNVFNDGIILYYLDRLLFKLRCQHIPFVWHLINLVIHLINCYLLYLVLTPLLGEAQATIAVFIWAIHPMLNQNVVWISGRPYTIATTLALVCMLYWNNPLIVIPLYGIAVVTNLSVGLLPVIIKLIHPSWQANTYIIIMLGVGIPFTLWKFHKRFTAALVLDRENFKFRLNKFNNIVRVYAYYVWGLVCPTKMGWYHQAGFRYNHLWSKFNVWALVGYVLMFYIMSKGISGWWFILGMLPNVNLFATNSFVQDRYVYFGTIGLAMILAPLFYAHPELIYIYGVFYGATSYRYNRQMLNDEKMYRENWRNHPESDYAVNNLSFFLIQQKRFEEARVIIMRAMIFQDDNKMLWYNLGVTWAATGNFRNEEGKFRFLRAVECWKKCLELEPRWRKPADDLQKLLTILVEKKVVTTDVKQGVPGAPSITIPAMGEMKK